MTIGETMPAKKYYWKDPDKARQKKREYYAANRDVVKKRQKEYATRTKEDRQKYIRQYARRKKKEIREQQHRWYLNNEKRLRVEAKERREMTPNYNLKRRIRLHGISEERYFELMRLQGGGCAICGESSKTLFIDHNHACCPGKNGCMKCVRGLLCSKCNYAIGMLKDDEKLATRAASYLRTNGFLGRGKK